MMFEKKKTKPLSAAHKAAAPIRKEVKNESIKKIESTNVCYSPSQTMSDIKIQNIPPLKNDISKNNHHRNEAKDIRANDIRQTNILKPNVVKNNTVNSNQKANIKPQEKSVSITQKNQSSNHQVNQVKNKIPYTKEEQLFLNKLNSLEIASEKWKLIDDNKTLYQQIKIKENQAAQNQQNQHNNKASVQPKVTTSKVVNINRDKQADNLVKKIQGELIDKRNKELDEQQRLLNKKRKKEESQIRTNEPSKVVTSQPKMTKSERDLKRSVEMQYNRNKNIQEDNKNQLKLKEQQTKPESSNKLKDELKNSLKNISKPPQKVLDSDKKKLPSSGNLSNTNKIKSNNSSDDKRNNIDKSEYISNKENKGLSENRAKKEASLKPDSNNKVPSNLTQIKQVDKKPAEKLENKLKDVFKKPQNTQSSNTNTNTGLSLKDKIKQIAMKQPTKENIPINKEIRSTPKTYDSRPQSSIQRNDKYASSAKYNGLVKNGFDRTFKPIHKPKRRDEYEDDDYEDDSFIEKDDEMEPYAKKMYEKLRKHFYKGRIDDNEDDDIEEVGYDELDKEERISAKIGAQEDYVEFLKDQKMRKKK